MKTVEKKPAICGVCPGGCGIIATVKNGKLIKVEPDKDTPYGNLCIRGRAAPEIVYSPDRLTTPLIRSGEKGRGDFRTSTWDEALDLVVKRMKKIRDTHGAHAFVYHYGRGAFEESLREFEKGFLYPYGSPNMAGVGSVCFVSFGILAPVPTFGVGGVNLIPDIENSKTVVIWGANPITDSPPTMLPRIMNARKRGARIITIDHMKSDIARRSDQWIPVRSGTDGALALGMMRILINEGIYDKEFVENWTVGFEELKEYVQSFTPGTVERITGVPAETMVDLAREIGRTKHVSLRMYTGLEYTNSGVQNIRATYLLWALAGHLDVPGGLLIRPPMQSFRTLNKVESPKAVKAIGSSEYPLFWELVKNAQFMEFPKAVLEEKPYPVKGLLINGASTLTAYPQPELWERTYNKLDFMVVIDLFMTGEARFADVILPAATYFEKHLINVPWRVCASEQPVIKPEGQARNSLLIRGDCRKT